MTINDTPTTLWWTNGVEIDGDGAPKCYNLDNHSGLDYLANAKDGDKWVGIVTDSQGNPIIQGANDPAPGFCVSPTALRNKLKNLRDPTGYVDSSTIPYMSVPSNAIEEYGVKLGDLCLIYNQIKQLHVFGVVADVGPRNKWGEISIAAATSVGVESSPKNGGASRGITCLVFKGTSKGWPRTIEDINAQGAVLLATFGGIDKLK